MVRLYTYNPKAKERSDLLHLRKSTQIMAGHLINASDQAYRPEDCNRVLKFELKDDSGEFTFLP